MLTRSGEWGTAPAAQAQHPRPVTMGTATSRSPKCRCGVDAAPTCSERCRDGEQHLGSHIDPHSKGVQLENNSNVISKESRRRAAICQRQRFAAGLPETLQLLKNKKENKIKPTKLSSSTSAESIHEMRCKIPL